MKLQLALRDLFWLILVMAMACAWWLERAAFLQFRRDMESDRRRIHEERETLAQAQADAERAQVQAQQAIRTSEQYREGYLYGRESLEQLKRKDPDGEI